MVELLGRDDTAGSPCFICILILIGNHYYTTFISRLFRVLKLSWYCLNSTHNFAFYPLPCEKSPVQIFFVHLRFPCRSTKAVCDEISINPLFSHLIPRFVFVSSLICHEKHHFLRTDRALKVER